MTLTMEKALYNYVYTLSISVSIMVYTILYFRRSYYPISITKYKQHLILYYHQSKPGQTTSTYLSTHLAEYILFLL